MRVGLSRSPPPPKRSAAGGSPRARRKALLLLSFGLPPYAQAIETPWTPLAADALSAADGYQQSGDWDQAITHYRRALQISPMPPAFQRYVIYNNLGWSMYHMGDWGKAEEHYKHALRASPQPPPTDHAYINLATLHKAENRIKPTIKAYRAAVALTHQSPTWAQLGWALMQDYQLDEATQTLHDALAYRGDDAPAAQESHHSLGRALLIITLTLTLTLTLIRSVTTTWACSTATSGSGPRPRSTSCVRPTSVSPPMALGARRGGGSWQRGGYTLTSRASHRTPCPWRPCSLRSTAPPRRRSEA